MFTQVTTFHPKLLRILTKMFTQVTTFHPKLLRILTNQTRPILEQHYASLYNLPWCIEEIVYDPL